MVGDPAWNVPLPDNARSVLVKLKAASNEMQADAERHRAAAPAGDLTSYCADGGDSGGGATLSVPGSMATFLDNSIADCSSTTRN